jgi:hypothetical protein
MALIISSTETSAAASAAKNGSHLCGQTQNLKPLLAAFIQGTRPELSAACASGPSVTCSTYSTERGFGCGRSFAAGLLTCPAACFLIPPLCFLGVFLGILGILTFSSGTL